MTDPLVRARRNVARARLDLLDAEAELLMRETVPFCTERDCGRPAEFWDICRVHARESGYWA